MIREKISISEEELIKAQSICTSIIEDSSRERGIANVLSASIASNFFKEETHSIDEFSGLHNITNVVEDIDISDIYIDNRYFDVRIIMDNDNLLVPVEHFTSNRLPFAYMFIKIDSKLSSAELIGFILPSNIIKETENNGYYKVARMQLVSFEDLNIDLDLEFGDNTEEDINTKEIFTLFECDFEHRLELYKRLLKSKNSRLRLQKISKANSVFNMIDTPNGNVEKLPDTEISSKNNSSDKISSYSLEYQDNFDTNNIQETNIPATSVHTENDIYSTVPNNDENLAEQIDTLFGEEDYKQATKPRKRSILPLLILVLAITLLVTVGKNYVTEIFSNRINSNNTTQDVVENKNNEPIISEDTMPNETVENASSETDNELGNPNVSIPAIENNLDTSILISRLKIDWQVPVEYSSNTAAQKYFIKVGKIIQLHLKRELLLLTKPPLSNKITLELNYDDNTGIFNITKIKDSSGEQIVDELIQKTINDVLKTTPFNVKNIQGKVVIRPLLIIYL